MPVCPRCGSELEARLKKDGSLKGYECEACEEFFKPEELREVAIPGTDVDHLPALLAAPLHELSSEQNPVLALWALCDFVELSLRFVVAVGMADLRRLHRDQLPTRLVDELRNRVEAPTLGKWRGMAEAVVAALTPGEATVPEFRTFIMDGLSVLLGDAKKGTPENSLAALRNQLAHGGGVTRAKAGKLLEAWRPRVAELCTGLNWMAELALVAKTRDGRLLLLRGTESSQAPNLPPPPGPGLEGEAGSLSLVRGERSLPLWPVALFGTPRHRDPETPPAEGEVAQIYTRRAEEGSVQFTPLGSEEASVSWGDDDVWKDLESLFGLRRPREEATRFRVHDFEQELRKDESQLVGREQELETIRSAVHAPEKPLLWITGQAGIGKTFVVAAIAVELMERPPADTVVLPFRFKAGDDRCSRLAFLRFAIERIEKLAPEKGDEKEEKKGGETARDLQVQLEKLLGEVAPTKVLFVLDGLDEVAERDPTFAREVVAELSKTGATLLCSGRPERGLPEVFAPEWAMQVFPEGLPPMSPEDVRAMLIEKIGPLRKKLVGNDKEKGGEVTNAFVDRVHKAAQGLPIYVKYVVGDVLSGKYSGLDGDAGRELPPSLDRYYEEMLKRCNVGTLQLAMNALVGTLAVAKEALSAEAIADILARSQMIPADSEALPTVRKALGAVASMLKRAPTPEGDDGYTLYHHSLRQHLERNPDTAGLLTTARARLCDLAASCKHEAASGYLYRNGVAHLAEVARRNDALSLLTDFDYLMARLRRVGDPGAVDGVFADWARVRAGGLDDDQRIWEAFFREKVHILRRGEHHWPSYKILLQLAAEHADESPVTKQAEAWLEQGHCDWEWLRSVRRPKEVPRSALRVVMEGHTGAVIGALRLPSGDILSWSDDTTLRIWDPDSGACRTVLDGNTRRVGGALLLPGGDVLSWSYDGTLRAWDPASGACRTVMEGHTDWVKGALLLPGGDVLSWSSDKTLRTWDLASGACRTVMEGHTGRVEGALQLQSGEVLSWSLLDTTLRIWDPVLGVCRVEMAGHTKAVDGALLLPGGDVLSWSYDGTLRTWDPASGACRAVMEGHTRRVLEALTLPSGQVLSWSNDKTARIWDPVSGVMRHAMDLRSAGEGQLRGMMALPDGQFLAWCMGDSAFFKVGMDAGGVVSAMRGHTSFLNGALLLPDGDVLSWSEDGTLRVWAARSGACRAVLAGHDAPVTQVLRFHDGAILSCGGRTLRLWGLGHDTQPVVEECHSSIVSGAIQLPDGKVLSWATRGDFRVWNAASGTSRQVVEGSTEPPKGCVTLADGDVAYWCLFDKVLHVRNAATGRLRCQLKGHTRDVGGALRLPGGDVLSWSNDGTMRVWDPSSGTCRMVFQGHQGIVRGALVLSGGQCVSWSDDKSLRTWDLNSGSCLAVMTGHEGRIRGGLVLAGGSVVSWAEDRSLRLWDPLAGECRGMVGALPGSAYRVHRLPGDDIASISIEGGIPTVRTWSTKTLACKSVMPLRESLWASPVSRPFEDPLLEIDRDWRAVFAPKGKPSLAWESPSRIRTALRCSPGHTVVVGMASGSCHFLRLWDGNRPEPIYPE